MLPELLEQPSIKIRRKGRRLKCHQGLQAMSKFSLLFTRLFKSKGAAVQFR